MAGRRHTTTNWFSPHDSNTICDRTGFLVKKSEVRKTWEGFYVIPEAWHPRHRQDFPIIPVAQRTIPDVRTENLDTDTVATFETI